MSETKYVFNNIKNFTPWKKLFKDVKLYDVTAYSDFIEIVLVLDDDPTKDPWTVIIEADVHCELSAYDDEELDVEVKLKKLEFWDRDEKNIPANKHPIKIDKKLALELAEDCFVNSETYDEVFRKLIKQQKEYFDEP